MLGISRNTVKAALAADGPPKYRAAAGGVGGGCGRAADPGVAAGVSDDAGDGDRGADRLDALDPDACRRGSRSCGRCICRRIRRRGRRMSRVRSPSATSGSPTITLPVGFGQIRTAKQLPVLTMVSGYSRWRSAVLIPTRERAGPVCRLVAAASTELGAVPRVLVWDGEGAVGRWRARKPELTAECQAFRGTLATKVMICKPARPGGQGAGRAAPRLPGDARSCRAGRSPARRTSTPSCRRGLRRANTRQHRALGCAPADRIDADRAAMLPLPPVAAGDRVAVLDAAAAGPLRAPGQQRLLGPPVGGRPPDRGRRRPGPGAGVLRRAAGRRPRAGLGEAPDDHRPGASRRSRKRCARATVRRVAAAAGAASREVRGRARRWPTTTRALGIVDGIDPDRVLPWVADGGVA